MKRFVIIIIVVGLVSCVKFDDPPVVGAPDSGQSFSAPCADELSDNTFHFLNDETVTPVCSSTSVSAQFGPSVNGTTPLYTLLVELPAPPTSSAVFDLDVFPPDEQDEARIRVVPVFGSTWNSTGGQLYVHVRADNSLCYEWCNVNLSAPGVSSESSSGRFVCP